ncbi:MAG: CBS domain-containing protein [Kofleriaceae bacterium]|nr:CBS domain-containing protein [Kofleriaceae bacterium]MBP6836643.1 CBS domain-containing protein [Kofleriaceae bacterium]MBP9207357.1 CBS domain-containing protein [Kofleriaceae bacterium]
MTTTPFTIGAEQPLERAQALMRTHQIRHLPVLRGGKLEGMVTERDVALIEALDGVDPGKMLVEDAMTTDVYAVAPDAPLDEVAREMASRKYGSAVVVDNTKVVGIFTTVDLAAALAELLHGRLAR